MYCRYNCDHLNFHFPSYLSAPPRQLWTRVTKIINSIELIESIIELIKLLKAFIQGITFQIMCPSEGGWDESYMLKVIGEN